MIELNEKVLTSGADPEALYNSCVSMTPEDRRPKTANEAIRTIEALGTVSKNDPLLAAIVRRCKWKLQN